MTGRYLRLEPSQNEDPDKRDMELERNKLDQKRVNGNAMQFKYGQGEGLESHNMRLM